MADQPTKDSLDLPRNRLIGGIAIFVIGHMGPLAIPLLSATSLSASAKTIISGLLIFGIPELSILLSVVVLGKAGFNALKARIFGWLGRTLLPSDVSRPRYYLGLIMFLIPFLIGWASPYVLEAMPELIQHQLVIAITGDVILIAGLCLMGGQSWDKLRSLFIYGAEVSFPPSPGAAE